MRWCDYYGSPCPSVLSPEIMQKPSNSYLPWMIMLRNFKASEGNTGFIMENYVTKMKGKKKNATFNFIIIVYLKSLTMFCLYSQIKCD